MNGTIVSYKEYVAGWLDSSIHDFLKVLPTSAVSMKYALITCLDSSRNLDALRLKSPELKSIAKDMETLGSGLLLPTELLLETDVSTRIFFGFDEVWFFPNKNIQPKPASSSIVGPARLKQARFDKMGEWMADNSCTMALGDGEGLNFVVRARGLVRFLLGYSIEQPESSLAAV